MNCWEFMKCGREPGGEKTDELGICPAAVDTSLDGKNNGKDGGRYCWKVAGTFCKGDVQGTVAMKIFDCIDCEFFKKVMDEEGDNFIFSLPD